MIFYIITIIIAVYSTKQSTSTDISNKSPKILEKCGNNYCLPGWNHLGESINLVTGEPSGIMAIDVSFNRNKVVRDHWRNRTWGIPDQFSAIFAGDGRESVHIFNSTTHYMNYMSTKSGANIGFGRWFSASAETEKVNKIVHKRSFEYTLTEQGVRVYRLKLIPSNLRVNLSLDLEEEISYLPLKYDKDTYIKFIKRYGTHYIDQVDIGGKGQTETAIMTSYTSRYNEQKIQMEAGIEFSWLKANGRHERHKRERHREWVTHSVVNTRVIGGDPTQGFDLKDWSKWLPTVAFAPEKLSYKVELLSTIIRDKVKSDNIKRGILEYLADNDRRDNPPKIVPNCRHLSIYTGINRPQNGIRRVGELPHVGIIPQSLWLINGPNENDECLVSFSSRNKNNNMEAEEHLVAYSSRLRVEAHRSTDYNRRVTQQCVSFKVNNEKYDGHKNIFTHISVKPKTIIKSVVSHYCCPRCHIFRGVFSSWGVVYQPRLYYEE